MWTQRGRLLEGRTNRESRADIYTHDYVKLIASEAAHHKKLSSVLCDHPEKGWESDAQGEGT